MFWRFKSILSHQGPINNSDCNYKGSKYNVLVEWEDGSQSYKPLDIIAEDDPVSCAKYASNNKLLNTPGWKQFRRLGRRAQKLERLINQRKLKSFREKKTHQFGFQVPRTPAEAIELNKANGNTKWQDAMQLEIDSLMDYETFEDLGENAKKPEGYLMIRLHWVFAVKHDGQHKARCVAGGHLTPPPVESVYSGVVSMRDLRIVIFLSELNDLEVYGADVGNAYLEATTKEKVCFKAGPEFGDLKGHTMIILKALYGLKTSGKRWYEGTCRRTPEDGIQTHQGR